MNLYDKASLIITPNAYKANKIYSAKPTDGSGDLTFSRASTAMRRNSAGLWESVANNVPRLHYPVGGGCPSWLMEPAATNLLTRSIAYSNAVWTKQNSGTTFTLTDNFATAPDGTLTACKYEFTAMDSAGKFFSVYQAPTVAATTYTTSIWMKGAVGGEKIYLYGSLLGTPTLITLTADWVLYTVTNTVTAGAKPFLIGGEFGASGMGALAAGTIYLWNSQVETGSVATSPIITAGSTVTRLADVQGNTPNLALTDFTFFMNFTVNKSAVGLHTFYNSALATIFYLAVHGPGNYLVINSVLGGGANNVALLNAIGSRNKIAIRLSGGFIKPVVNGVVLSSIATTAADFKTYGQLNSFGFNDHYSSYTEILYPTALSDSEAIALTTL